jgi:GAF domain
LGWQAAAVQGSLARQLEPMPAHRVSFHQATGMLSVQAAVSVEDAQLLLRAYAFAENVLISDVVRDVTAAGCVSTDLCPVDSPVDRAIHSTSVAATRDECAMAREQALVETFVGLVDSLVDDYDVVDFLRSLATRCVELLDVSEAGIALVDSDGKLRYMASSSEQMRLVELLELQLEEGPCLDAYRQRHAVLSRSQADISARWPRFASHVRGAGFASMSAVPMRLRDQVIGALNLFSTRSGDLSDEDLRVAQAMADSPPSASSTNARSVTPGLSRGNSKRPWSRASRSNRPKASSPRVTAWVSMKRSDGYAASPVPTIFCSAKLLETSSPVPRTHGNSTDP